jgi:multidrug resistance protein, MATE family
LYYTLSWGVVPIIMLYFVGQLHAPQQDITVIMAGISLSTTFANVTGVSVLIGLASAVETMASQLYGSHQYREVGYVVQRSILILGLACIPIFIVWHLAPALFHMCGVSTEICHIVGVALRIRALGLPMDVIRYSLERYLTAINVTRPLMIASLFLDIELIILCFSTVIMSQLDYTSICYNFIISSYLGGLVLIAVCSRNEVVMEPLQYPSLEAFLHWGDFLKLGGAGALMLCCEWWAYEILVLMAGFLGTAAIDAQSIILMFVGLLYSLPLGFSTVVSVHIGQCIGAGRLDDAKIAGYTGTITIILVQGALSLAVWVVGPWYVAMFTSDEHVLSLIRHAIAYVCAFVLLDGLQNVGSGILRGAGKQNLGAALNFIAFYLIGLPMSYVICFRWDFGVSGLILGMTFANAFQALAQQLMLTVWPDVLFAETGAWLNYHNEPERAKYTAIPDVELVSDGDGNDMAEL